MNTLFGNAYSNRRVLVTGHTGFKGAWLTSWLLELGAEVCGYSDGVQTEPSLFAETNLSDMIRDERGDIRDGERLASLMNAFRPHYVFHLAAQSIVSISYAEPARTFSVNVMGTVAVLEALRRLDHPCAAVIITSDKAYDNVEWCWGYRESDRLGGKDVYSGSKGAAELAFYSFYNSFFKGAENKVRLATARAGNVIGGGDWAPDRIVADCMRAWCEGATVRIRSPSATRPWQHVLEPLSGYLTLAAGLGEDLSFHGQSFNFGPKADQNATVLELLSELARVWGYESPSEAYHVANEIPFHEASLLKLNIDKAMLALRWQPTLTYAECVEMTGTWYRDVVKYNNSAMESTRANILTYTTLASLRHQNWAR